MQSTKVEQEVYSDITLVPYEDSFEITQNRQSIAVHKATIDDLINALLDIKNKI